MGPINWQDEHSQIILNPSYSRKETLLFHTLLDQAREWPSHIWLATSGSFALKWVGISKEALLASAASVNNHLKSNAADIWIHALPDFHVGGVAIWARAFLSGASVCDYKKEPGAKWNPMTFYSYLTEQKGTLTSLVPAQLIDFVRLGLKAPKSLRAVLLGGGALAAEIYASARLLQWPVLQSYGLTECGSTIAAAPLNSLAKGGMSEMELLCHVQAYIREGRICLKSPSLFSLYAFFEGDKIIFRDAKEEGWFLTEDRGVLNGKNLVIEGRADGIVKVGGENVDVNKLENLFSRLLFSASCETDAALLPMPDSRLGHAIHLACACSISEPIQELIDSYNAAVLPFERIRKVHLLPFIPRSPLGKILKKQLVDLCFQNNISVFKYNRFLHSVSLKV